MAYEISEGATSGALLIPYSKLKKESLDTPEKIKSAMQQIYDNLKDVKGTGPEKSAYQEWLNPANNYGKTHKKKSWDARVTSVIHGYSAARAIKTWMVRNHGESYDLTGSDDVYLTGGQWDDKIGWLKVKVRGWTDYNSSDLIIVRGKCYYGVSLKKKNTPTSADPPMINKSIVELLQSLNKVSGVSNILNELKNMKSGFFAEILSDNRCPIKGFESFSSTKKGNEALFYGQIRHPKSKKGWISFIDLKGGGLTLKFTGTANISTSGPPDDRVTSYRWWIRDVDEENKIVNLIGTDPSGTQDELLKINIIQKLFGVGEYKSESNWDMRKHVNSYLGNENKFYREMLKIVDNDTLSKSIGEILLSSVLKTELSDAITESKLKTKWSGKHFGFALITAIGKYELKKSGASMSFSEGNVKENPVIQSVVGSLIDKKSGTQWQIRKSTTADGVDLSEWKRTEASKAGRAAPAKLFFTVGIEGKSDFHPVLDLQIRYKGTFTPWPQFIGGMTDYFINLIKEKDADTAKKAWADCETT